MKEFKDKKKNQIKWVEVGDRVIDNISDEIVLITYVGKVFIEGFVIEGFKPKDNFDTGKRQFGNGDYTPYK